MRPKAADLHRRSQRNTALPTFFPAHASLAVGHPSDY